MPRTVIYNLPIEPVEMRYTIQWRRWFDDAFQKCGFEVKEIMPPVATTLLAKNAFLDPMITNLFKADQAARLLDNIQLKCDIDPATRFAVFFQDLWHPAITQLLYLRDVGKFNIQYCGCLHAGSYVPHDRLAPVYKAWAGRIEEAWLTNAALIIVGSQYHQHPIYDTFAGRFEIELIPWPVEMPSKEFDLIKASPPVIIWPHRYADEKQPDVFEWVCQQLKKEGQKFDSCQPILQAKNKAEYYWMLKDASIAVSTALEETFGIAMVEATCLGCIPIVPDHLSYPEMYPPTFCYKADDPWKLVALLDKVLDNQEWFRTEAKMLAAHFRRLYDPANQTAKMVTAVCALAR